jgi:hypothetical protein
VFARSRGQDPNALSSDLAGIVALIQTSASEFANGAALRRAAEVFLGNVLAAQRPEAQWQVWDDGPQLVGNQRVKFDPAHIIGRLMEGDQRDGEELVDVVRAWQATPDLSADALDPLPVPVPSDDSLPACLYSSSAP